MTPPDAPAAGTIRGKEFRPDKVVLEPGGRLVLRQGKEFFAWFHERRLSAIAEETLDRQADLLGAAAGNPRDGWHLITGL